MSSPKVGDKPERWMLYDDANASYIGEWDKVVEKCSSGRIQPSVLFFESALFPPFTQSS